MYVCTHLLHLLLLAIRPRLLRLLPIAPRLLLLPIARLLLLLVIPPLGAIGGGLLLRRLPVRRLLLLLGGVLSCVPIGRLIDETGAGRHAKPHHCTGLTHTNTIGGGTLAH